MRGGNASLGTAMFASVEEQSWASEYPNSQAAAATLFKPPSQQLSSWGKKRMSPASSQLKEAALANG